MKNIEKYTNTKDAMEAYNNSVKNVPFDEWLELEYKERTLLEAARLRNCEKEYQNCSTRFSRSMTKSVQATELKRFTTSGARH